MTGDVIKNGSLSISQCAICQVKADKKCTGCNEVAYCGRECQKKHWSTHRKECKCWKIMEDPNGVKGRCVYATRNIKSGQLIMADPEKPTLIGPHTVNPSPVCLGCFYPIHFVRLRCKKCNVPICEENCSRSPTHLLECDTISRSLKSNSSGDKKEFNDYNIITPLRFLLMKQKKPKEYEKLTSLVSNIESKKLFESDWSRICETSKYIFDKYLSHEDCTYTIEEIQTAISIIDSNTYHVLVRSGPMLQDFVCGVYTRAAMVNHSCRPNTRPIFRGKTDRTMSVIAIEDIEAGEEITTSYLEPFYTTMQRRALLKRGKHFDCCCKRCSDPTELNSYASAIRCTLCPEGWLLPIDPMSKESSWQCDKCKGFLPIDQVIKLDNSLVGELQRVNKKSLDNLEKFHKVYEKLLHPSHAFLMQLKQWLFEGYARPSESNSEITSAALSNNNDPALSISSLQRKISLGEQLLSFFDKVEGKGSFIRGVVYLEMCDALMKIATQAATKMSNEDMSSSINMIPIPVLCERAKGYLANANQLLEHEDPDGPESGGLIAGARQLELSLAQFQ